MQQPSFELNGTGHNRPACAWLDRSAQAAAELAKAAGSIVWLWDPRVDALQICAHFRMSDEYLAYGQQSACLEIAKERAPVYHAYRTGLLVDVPQPASAPEYNYFSEGFQDYPTKHIIVLPIGMGDQRVGALALYFNAAASLTEVEQLRLEVCATQIAGRILQDGVRRQLENKIVELEQANGLLTGAVNELKDLDRLKSTFVSAISHELRTPLTSIMGYAEFLEDEVAGPLSPGQRTFVDEIQGGSLRLLQLVDDLLDFARLEAGTFGLTFSEADLNEVTRKALESLMPLALKAGVTLEQDLASTPLVAFLDPGRTGQVILNLVNNAIKFTPPGGKVVVSTRSSGDVHRVEVQDNGIGIPAESLARLFDKFYQVDPGLTRVSGGVGLGLAISKALVDAQGGEIGVTSEPGKGSRFWFELARLPACRLVPTDAGSQSSKGR